MSAIEMALTGAVVDRWPTHRSVSAPVEPPEVVSKDGLLLHMPLVDRIFEPGSVFQVGMCSDGTKTEQNHGPTLHLGKLMTASTARPLAGLTSRQNRWLALGVVLLLSAALRLHGISAVSLWFDEGVSWDQASQTFLRMIRLMAADKHPPLYISILHFAILAFGDSEFALRLPSAVLGVAGVAAIFWVGMLIDGPATGFLSSALLSLSGIHVYYSQEARPYSLLALTAMLFAGATIRALETNRREWHAVSALASLLLLYSHAYGLLLWFSLAVAIIVGAKACRDPAPKTLAKWAAWQAVAVLLFLPWAGILVVRYKDIVTHGFWIQKPDAPFVLAIVEHLASGGVMALALTAGVILSLAVPSGSPVAVAGSRRPSEGHIALHRLLLVAWLLGPLVLGLTASLISQPILIDKYLIGSLPAWLILASSGFCRLYSMWGKWVLAVAVGAATANLWFYLPPRHEDVRAAVKAYVEQAQPTDCVLLFYGYFDVPVSYYLRHRPSCFVRSYAATDIRPWELDSPRAWLFLGHIDANQRRAVTENLQAHGWQTRTVTGSLGLELLVAEREP